MRNRGGEGGPIGVQTGRTPDKTDRARPPRRLGSPASGSLGFCCWPVPATAAPMNPSEVLVKDSLRVFDGASVRHSIRPSAVVRHQFISPEVPAFSRAAFFGLASHRTIPIG